MKQNVPVAKGEVIETDVIDLAYGGDSIAKYNNFTVFLPYGVPGSRVVAKIIDVKNNFARGHIIKIIRQSEIYIKPPCPHFGLCGGCDWLNINYKKQVECKVKIVKNLISHIAGLPIIKISAPVIYENPFYYRNRAQYKLKFENKKIKLGFFKARSHEIISIDRCLLVSDEINKIKNILETGLNEKINTVSLYDEKNKRGYLRYITIKVNSNNESLITFIVTNKEKKNFISFVCGEIKKYVNNVKGIVLNINKNESNTVFGEKEVVLYGKSFITENFQDINFLISSSSFFQINFLVYKKMVDYIDKNTKNNVNVIDLYGGIGALTLPLKEKFNRIYVVDNENSNINKLKELCKKSNIKNVFPILANAEDVTERLLYEKRIDEVIIDPPRKGLHPKVLFILKNSNIRNIIYISCNPSTFARDLKVLKEKYYLKELIPIDQFAHTYHIELMAILEKKRKN